LNPGKIEKIKSLSLQNFQNPVNQAYQTNVPNKGYRKKELKLETSLVALARWA